LYGQNDRNGKEAVRSHVWIKATISCLLAMALGLGSVGNALANRFESEILAYEQQDLLSPPPKGAIVVTGSSTIVRWTSIRDDLAPLEIIPRGFGGSTADDLDYYLERIVLVYEPRAVVIYEGDNDIAQGWTPQYVATRISQIAGRISARFPSARVYIISIKPSWSRWGVWPQMQQANQLLADFCASDPRYQYIDTASALLGADGFPRTEYYASDTLHLSAAGYTVWAGVVRPVLLAGEQPANVAPVVTSPGNQSGTVGVAVSLSIAASDADGDPLAYSASGLPAGLTINASSGRISGTPSAAGTSNVTVTASDGRGGTGTASFTWTVMPANVAPVVTSPGNQSGTVGVAVSLLIVANDANGDPLAYSASGLPAGLSINSSTGRITGSPSTAGTANVTVTVNDGRGGTGTANFTWTVSPAPPPPPVNAAPTVSDPGNQSSQVGVAVSLAIAASDANGDPLTHTATNLPAGLTIEASSGRISGTPTSAGTFNVTVTVSDGRGGTGTASFAWTVAPANVAPVVTSPGNQSGTVGVVVNTSIFASDTDGDRLAYSATGLPAGLTIDASTGRISGTPSASGTSNVTVTVNDGRGGTDAASFTWTIAPATHESGGGGGDGGGGGSLGSIGALLMGLAGFVARRRRRA
jgi:lysophospholipase L1-like esterase